LVALFESQRHVLLGEHPVEVDLDVVEPDLLRIAADPAQETGLAVATRGREPGRVASLGKREQSLSLLLAVDQVLGIERTAEDERVDLGHLVWQYNTKWYGNTVLKQIPRARRR
jgi:hypothetical protein